MIVLGSGNDTLPGYNDSLWIDTDPILMVGNGYYDFQTNNPVRSTALTILKNGKTGIGTMAPEELLHIKSNTDSATLRINCTSGGTSKSRSKLQLFKGNAYGWEFQLDGTNYQDKLYLWSRKFAGNEAIRMTWLKDGRIGMATASPTAQLSLGEWDSGTAGTSGTNTQLKLSGKHDTRFNAAGFKLLIEGYDNDDITVTYPIYCKDEDSNIDFWLRSRNGVNGYPLLYLNGRAGIQKTSPEEAVDVNGKVQALGFTDLSDRRFKKDLESIPNAPDLLEQINGYRYYFRTAEFPERGFDDDRQIGLIAQEVEAVFPELVETNSDGFKAVRYDGLIPVLIEVMKEQQTTIKDQESGIRELELMVENQGSKVQMLEEELAAFQSPISILEEENEILKEENRLIKAELSQLREMVEQIKSCCEENTLQPSSNDNSQATTKQQAWLSQNQPNPFDQETEIQYFIPKETRKAELRISDTYGRVLDQFRILTREKGATVIQSSAYRAGTYFYSLILDGEIFETKKMVLLSP
jgi:hypothetical protein